MKINIYKGGTSYVQWTRTGRWQMYRESNLLSATENAFSSILIKHTFIEILLNRLRVPKYIRNYVVKN